MHLDKQHPVPIYRQLKEMLQSQIEQGLYYSHQKLPSERDLCRDYNLSRMTARRALQELIEEGLAYTRVGKGTFVSDHYPHTINQVTVNTFQKSADLAHTLIGERCRTKLVKQLLTFDTIGVELTMKDVVANHSLEVVATMLFPQIIRELDKQWDAGSINLVTQNYAITTLRCQLTAMINAVGQSKTGPKVLLACAPEDQHEIGLLLLALILKRRGFRVIYLGPDVHTEQFRQVANTIQPDLICFSAATERSAKNLAMFSWKFDNRQPQLAINGGNAEPNPRLAFGGTAFSQNPSLVTSVSGLYLGHSIDAAALKIENILKI